MKESSVAPGGIASFEFAIAPPRTGGEFKEYFNLVAEDRTWMNDNGFYLLPRVLTYTWSPAGQAAFGDPQLTTPIDITHLRGSQKAWLQVTAQHGNGDVAAGRPESCSSRY